MNASNPVPLAPTVAPPLLLGLGGLLPFVVLALMVEFGPEAWRRYSMVALSSYGAGILGFVGALHWAYALKLTARGGDAWWQYGFSVVPSLVAWVSLLLPVWTALRLQALALLACYAVDCLAAQLDPVPRWFLNLRAVLTVIAASCLGLASLG